MANPYSAQDLNLGQISALAKLFLMQSLLCVALTNSVQTLMQHAVQLCLLVFSGFGLQQGIAHIVAGTAWRRDKGSLAIGSRAHVTNHVKVLREQQQVHYLLRARTSHFALKIHNTRAQPLSIPRSITENVSQEKIEFNENVQ
jgi:hypothetical protein